MVHHMIRTTLIAVLACLTALAAEREPVQPPIDWQEIRRLLARERAAEDLTTAERERLAAARLERQRLQDEGRWPPPGFAGQAATPEASRSASLRRGPSTGLVPLTDMGSTTYLDADGGLYGGGANTPTEAMRAVEARLLADILPRGPDGQELAAEAGGRIGLVAIGMSNTNQEWDAFQRLAADELRFAPGLILVNGALGAHDVVMWGSGDAPGPWANLESRIAAAGLTAAQVQAVWLKHAVRLPQIYGPWPGHVRATTAELRIVVSKLTARFPCLRIVHLSSRTYGGWDERAQPASPEPYAYESAYAVRALILSQAAGEWSLNPDPQAGPVRAPLLRWGPYLWADGERARADGLSWPRQAFADDGVHPSHAGRAAVARLLASFYLTDLSAAWVRRP